MIRAVSFKTIGTSPFLFPRRFLVEVLIAPPVFLLTVVFLGLDGEKEKIVMEGPSAAVAPLLLSPIILIWTAYFLDHKEDL